MTPPIIARGSLGGRTIHSFEAAGFIFTETRHAPFISLRPHANDRATIVAVLRGDYVETLGGCVRAHRPGTLIVRPPSEVHSNSIGRQGATCLLIELTEGRFETMRDHRTFDEPRTIEPGLAWSPALRAAKEIAAPDAVTPLLLEAHALEILAQAMRRSSIRTTRDRSPWLERVREAVHSYDGEACPTLADLARMVGHHPVYVARAFRARFGCSIGEYARRRRLWLACERLVDSDMTLSEIASWAGFHDQSHFSRWLRHYTGLSPGGFRRAIREGSSATDRVRAVLDGKDARLHPGAGPPRA